MRLLQNKIWHITLAVLYTTAVSLIAYPYLSAICTTDEEIARGWIYGGMFFLIIAIYFTYYYLKRKEKGKITMSTTEAQATNSVDEMCKEAEKHGITPEQLAYLRYLEAYLNWAAWSEPEKLEEKLENFKAFTEEGYFQSDYVLALRKIAQGQLAKGKVEIAVADRKGNYTPEYAAYLIGVRAYLYYIAWSKPEELEGELTEYHVEIDNYLEPWVLADLRNIANTKENS